MLLGPASVKFFTFKRLIKFKHNCAASHKMMKKRNNEIESLDVFSFSKTFIDTQRKIN